MVRILLFAALASLPLWAQPSRAVLTHHNDIFRTGAYLSESQLTPALIDQYGMRQKCSIPVTGGINAQLLYVPGERNVIYAATSSNYVGAFDASDCTLLWAKIFNDPETDRRGIRNGIQSTPVIDLETSTMYLVFSTKNRNAEPGEDCERPQMDVAFWLAAIDIRSGDTLRYTKVQGSVTRDDGTELEFYGTNHYNRPALLLSNGSIYIAFGMRFREECMEYHGWVMRYDAETFAPHGVFCTTPNARGTIWDRPSSGGGAGIWQGAGGLVADQDGNVYFTTGNGRLDFDRAGYGDGIVKLTPRGDTLEYAGSFPPDDPAYAVLWQILERNDVDLGSGGMMMIPDTENLVGGGKTGIWYLLDRHTMTSVEEFTAFTNQENPDLRDQGWDVGPHLHGSPAYWRGPNEEFAYVYQWSEKDHLKGYKYYFKSGQFDEDSPVMNTEVCPNTTMPGGMFSLSANGNQKGTAIIWAVYPSGDHVRTKPLARRTQSRGCLRA
jgi:hypothetical protein